MTYFINTAESGLTNGTSITLASQTTAGSAGSQFTPTRAQNGNITIDTGIKHRGAASYKAVAGADGDVARADITISSTVAALECYNYITAYPAAETAFAHIRNSAGVAAFLNLNSSGQIRVYNAANAALFLTTGTVPLNAWWRWGLAAAAGSTTSNGTLRFGYSTGANLESTTSNENFTQSGIANVGTTTFSQLRVLKIGSLTPWTIWADDIQWRDDQSTLIGPVSGSTPAPPVLSYSQQTILRVDPSATSGTGVVFTLTRTSGPTTTITGPDADNKFEVVIPAGMATPLVLSLKATDSSGQTDTETITVQPGGGTTTVLVRDFMVYDGTNWIK